MNEHPQVEPPISLWDEEISRQTGAPAREEEDAAREKVIKGWLNKGNPMPLLDWGRRGLVPASCRRWLAAALNQKEYGDLTNERLDYVFRFDALNPRGAPPKRVPSGTDVHVRLGQIMTGAWALSKGSKPSRAGGFWDALYDAFRHDPQLFSRPVPAEALLVRAKLVPLKPTPGPRLKAEIPERDRLLGESMAEALARNEPRKMALHRIARETGASPSTIKAAYRKYLQTLA